MAEHKVNIVAYGGTSTESVGRFAFSSDAMDREAVLAAAEEQVRRAGYWLYEGESTVRYDYGDGSLCVDVPVHRTEAGAGYRSRPTGKSHMR